MDGVSMAKMQVSIGVREIVEDIDGLRVMLGFDHVNVLTPKVETRLRSAARAAIPLKLSCTISVKNTAFAITVEAILTFPGAYPIENILVETKDTDGAAIDELSVELQEYAASPWPIKSENSEVISVFEHVTHTTVYPRATDIINHLKRLLEVRIESESVPDVVSNDTGTENVPGNVPDASEDVPVESSAEHSAEASMEEDKYYSCMVCGHFLFHDSEVEKHSPTHKDFERRGGKVIPCSSVFTTCAPTFLEQQNAEKSFENTSKITCPKCTGKLGLVCWTGSQCSCGAWITPSFQFVNSKIDMKRKNFDILSYTNLKSSQPIIRKPLVRKIEVSNVEISN